MIDHGPEISDLLVDYDPETLARRPVRKQEVLDRLARRSAPLRVARTLGAKDGILDDAEVDGILVRSHLELQRLHEEFRVGALVRSLLVPLLDVVRGATTERPLRVVDIGCGLGFIARWLAKHGGLGDDVELVGADYNRALVDVAGRLATEEALPVRFVAANAFRLDPPAHVYLSTGVVHHFRGDDLARLFAEHQRTGAVAFLHLDIRPSAIAPLGSWVFHQARMREPLAKHDGYWSAVRAHDAATLLGAIRSGAPSFARSSVDAYPGIHALVRIFHGFVGVRAEHRAALQAAYAPLGRRVRSEP